MVSLTGANIGLEMIFKNVEMFLALCEPSLIGLEMISKNVEMFSNPGPPLNDFYKSAPLLDNSANQLHY